MNGTEFVANRGDHSVHILPVGDITDHSDRPSPHGSDLFGHRFSATPAHRPFMFRKRRRIARLCGDGNVAPFLCETKSDSSADSPVATGTRDNCDLSVKSSHV
jgi:hypothetical protein